MNKKHIEHVYISMEKIYFNVTEVRDSIINSQ